MKLTVCIILFLITNAFAAKNQDFNIYKKESNNKGHTLLIIGGIHGNEPGSYFAPAFFEKYYKITKGNVWVVPNLNVHSIMLNRRGIYNDMNRKFNIIEKNDPDYFTVQRIKKIILDKQVDLILNLHDGHGFYRKNYENSIFNPKAWGQATIIDQKKMDNVEKFGDLDNIASQVKENLNNDKLFKHYHIFNVKNTETKFKDEQQQLSLTFFAITNNKPAFAIETSKNIDDLTEKVVYQLKAIEEFMHIMDIKYERDFDINNYDEVKKRLFDFGKVVINDNITLDLSDIKNTLRFMPLKDTNKFEFEHPLGNRRYVNNSYELYIGNIKVTNIMPQKFLVKNYENQVEIQVDGKIQKVKLGQVINVKDSFKIIKNDFFRVNIIGCLISKELNQDDISVKKIKNSKKLSQDDILVKKNDILKAYSIDKLNNQYRVEFYKDDYFYGTITINFEKK